MQLPILQADGSWRFVERDSITPAELREVVSQIAVRAAVQNSYETVGVSHEAQVSIGPRVLALPAADWPLTARIVRSLRSADDQGIGDTIHRQLGALGRWFEAAASSLGINCGCADRQAWLNQRYPY